MLSYIVNKRILPQWITEGSFEVECIQCLTIFFVKIKEVSVLEYKQSLTSFSVKLKEVSVL